MKKNWWKEAVIYEIYPRSFKDSNGDGIGDLRGIIQKLDYLKKLGVDVLWLCPVYDSPNDDYGYDIRNYRKIIEEAGTMKDFDELLEGIHQRGIKLIMDLVVNHTSDEHEWFQKSRESKDNPYRDYYFWKPEKPNNWQSFFGGDAWEYDEKTGEWYLHLFTKKQPDLNWENPNVREKVHKMMRFWLEKGVDGFRLDVISLISKRTDFTDTDLDNFADVIEQVYANGPRLHEYLREMNEEVLGQYDIMTVGEAVGVPKNMALLCVGEDRNELDMIFQFDHMLMDAGPGGRFDPIKRDFIHFKRIFREWDEAVSEKGWNSIYLDNHDYPRMVSRFGNDQQYREESAKLLAMMLLTMRGTPCIFQGSELGMTNVAYPLFEDYRDVETRNAKEAWVKAGKDPDELLDYVQKYSRDNARTPMQWNSQKHAGFTEGIPWVKVNPNYTGINAEIALENQNSIFWFYKRLIEFRKDHPVLVYGNFEQTDKEHSQLFSYRRWDEDMEFHVLLNFSDKLCDITQFRTEGYKMVMTNQFELDIQHDQLLPWEGRVYQLGKS
ncbi:MAG: alpha-glucosidase [Balneolaceae bacterium]